MYNRVSFSALDWVGDMTSSIIYTFAIGIAMGVGSLIFFIWGATTGAFDQTEDAKYVVFRDDDED